MLTTVMREKVKSQATDLSKNAENGLSLTWICVEVKFRCLFREFSGLIRGEKEENLTGEERGEEKKKK